MTDNKQMMLTTRGHLITPLIWGPSLCIKYFTNYRCLNGVRVWIFGHLAISKQSLEGYNSYFIPSTESSAYLKQIKGIMCAVKKYRIFSLVTNTQQTEAVSTILGLISSRKKLECTVPV